MPFSRVDRERTQTARDRAADRAPLVFTLDEKNHARIPVDLRASLMQLRGIDELRGVPAETKRLFGLVENPDPQTAFDRLKSAISTDQKLTDVIEEFTRFLQRIEKTGLARPEHLPADRGGSELAEIHDESGKVESATLAEIQLSSVLAPGGRLEPSRWTFFPALLPLQDEFTTWLRLKSPETLIYDAPATQKLRSETRNETPPVIEPYIVGQQLVKAGDVIDEPKLELLQTEYEELEKQISVGERVLRVVVVFLMLTVLSVLIGYHLVHNEPKLVWSLPRFLRYVSLIVIGVWLGRWLSFDPWRAEIGVVLTAVMICAVAHNQVLATLTGFALSVVVTTACGGDLARFTVMMSVCATAVIFLPNVPTRSTLVVVGAWTAGVCFLMHWGTALIQSSTGALLWNDGDQWYQSLRSAGWCLAAGFLVSGSLPFIESWFGAVTDISLLELGDVSHPLLQELVRRAPGTYNHSITVASIGETAADAIGANGLLVRVGAYFHDIGKTLKPHYFIENALPGENRHEHLAPAMSTLIIIGHVKDGVDLGRQHGLPEPLIDFIEQHHG
ncbi:MAG: HDIG domain-containing protein, partial [Planctomycetota bacterium]|nr:HDIG domain-containing protein [Planctomycetota bacterium]